MAHTLEARSHAKPSSPIVGIEPVQRLHVSAVDWHAYELIGEAFRDRRGFRLNYDRGELEIMTLSPEHESDAHLLNRLIEVLAEELALPMKNLGSTTYKRKDLERGVEPDFCYYVTNLDQIRGIKRLDLTRDPVPDLIVEVEVTHSAVNRMGIFAALGIPEVWRYDGETLHVVRLEDGQYREHSRSAVFPLVAPEEFIHFVRQGFDQDDTTMARAFRQFVRQRLAVGNGSTPA